MVRIMKKKEKIKKRLSLLLLFALILTFISGCGNSSTSDSLNNTNGTGPSGSMGNAGQTDDRAAMGRYVEEVSDLSDKISGIGSGIYRLNNGNLILSDAGRDFMKTDNNGAIWMTDSRRWRTAMLENQTYIMSIAVGADNTVGLIYQADEDPDAESEAESDAESEDGSGSETEAEPEEEADIVLNPKLLIIKPDNTEISVDIALTEDDKYLNQVYIADNGRIFVSTRGSSNLYEVMEDGSSELFLTLEAGIPSLIQFQGNMMVVDGYGYDSLVIYDMEKEEYIEDEILNDFVDENYKNRDSNSGNFYDLYFFFGEDGILYLAGEKGLYRHAVGGSVLERLIDGNLCSLGNPAYGLQSMLALENNEFLALFSGCRMVHYTYDPDIPTVPNKMLRVYSLEDNEMIRQAINLYQTKNPEVYVEFENGMGGDNSVTREDALKNLNTKIAAGEGPDILLLDNMPLDSYIEKGLLLDLSPILDGLSGEEALFENVTAAMEKSGQIYVVPCEVNLPIMMLEKKDIPQINDLEDIADMIVTMREDNPEEDLLGLCSEKSIMRLFSMTCAPAWLTEEGDINSEAIREFLQQTKRIYDAQMEGIPYDVIDRYQQMAEAYQIYNGVASFEDSDYVRIAGINRMNYVGGYNKLLFGAFRCLEFTSILKIDDFQNIGWMPMKGQCSNVFWAETLLGINAASKQPELAEDFLRFCLGKESQSYFYDSLPVNQAAFDEMFALPEDIDSSGRWGSVATDGYDGSMIVLVYYWPSETEIAAYREYMETVDIAYYENDVLEDAVYEAGIAYMQGTQSLSEAVDAIEKKVAIYMAE